MGDFWNGHANGAPQLGSVWSCPSGMSLQEALTPLQTHFGRVLLEMLSHTREQSSKARALWLPLSRRSIKLSSFFLQG